MLPHEDKLSPALLAVGAHVRSPLALTGMMLSILRHRFHPNFNLPFVWKSVSDEDPYTEHPESTIRVEAGGESNRDAGSVKPGVYVVRQPIHVQQMVLDDMSSFGLQRGDRTFLARGSTGFTIICESTSKGASSSIADVVMSTFMMGANLIERTFNIHKLGPFSLSATSSVRKDMEVFETHVSIGMQYDLKWANLSLAPMFKEIIVKSANNDNFFVETYTKSFTGEE